MEEVQNNSNISARKIKEQKEIEKGIQNIGSQKAMKDKKQEK